MAVGRNHGTAPKQERASAEKEKSSKLDHPNKRLKLDIEAAQSSAAKASNDLTPIEDKILGSQQPAIDLVIGLPENLLSQTMTPSIFSNDFPHQLSQYEGKNGEDSKPPSSAGFRMGGLERAALVSGTRSASRRVEAYSGTFGSPFQFAAAAKLNSYRFDDELNRLSELWSVDSALKRDSTTPVSEISFYSDVSTSNKRPIEDDNISITSSVGTISRRSRIQPTDDPNLADKRARNRLAAEKCRQKRKSQQQQLQDENKILLEKYNAMANKFEELQALSKSVVSRYLDQNNSLRAENNVLKAAVGQLPKASLILQSSKAGNP